MKVSSVCEMTFTPTSHSWPEGEGEGSSKGGGITFGRSKIKDAIAKFTVVDSISDLFGSYAHGEAHAGAGKSAKASVVTKGDISLAIAGQGSGADVGVSLGKFTIEKAK